MRLLIVTQKVDKHDPILGFFHGWLRELATAFDSIEVIAQQVGAHSLPRNVTVHSLGKEKGSGKAAQVRRFWRLQWTLRSRYDAAFVHMTPIWAVIGAPEWGAFGKKIYLWYEARGARWPLRLALRVVTKVFSASPHGMPIATRKSVVTGHGIDTDLFCPGTEEPEPNLLLTVGRVTQAKNLPVLIRCLRDLPSTAYLVIVGRPLTERDKLLRADLTEQIGNLGLKGRVTIQERPHGEVRGLLRRCALFVHASATSLDKALLEAMACGCLTLSSSSVARQLLPPICQTTDRAMGESARRLLSLPAEEKHALREELRQKILSEHSLKQLAARLRKEIAA